MSSEIEIKLKLYRQGFKLDLDLTLPAEGVSVIFGSSGSGKTSLLRCLAGLEKQASGTLVVRGDCWQSPQLFLSTHKRPIGYVFQEASLFDHLNIRKNLQYAQKRAHRLGHSNTSSIGLSRVLALLDIEHLLDRMPVNLSGGERQRVAIARALLINPSLLLMDEPLASLDHNRKQEILPYLEQLKSEFQLPIVYVTHSADELARLADHLVILNAGQVVAQGKPDELLARLDLPFNLGEETGVVLDGCITELDTQWQLATAKVGSGSLRLRSQDKAVGDNIRIRVFARDVSLSNEQPRQSSILNSLPARVVELKPDQSMKGATLVKLETFEQFIVARVSTLSAHELNIQPGKQVWAQIKSVAIVQ